MEPLRHDESWSESEWVEAMILLEEYWTEYTTGTLQDLFKMEMELEIIVMAQRRSASKDGDLRGRRRESRGIFSRALVWWREPIMAAAIGSKLGRRKDRLSPGIILKKVDQTKRHHIDNGGRFQDSKATCRRCSNLMY
jgi:hypothetical protein